MTNTLVKGSIGAIAQQTNKSIAEAFTNCDIVVLVDTSGSMDSRDSRAGTSRYETACCELESIQNDLPGKIAVLSFSDEVMFNPEGKPFYFGGGTDLAKALQFARVADVPEMRFILISDGEPDDEDRALQTARLYQNKIDVIYVGPEDRPYGRDFLQRLAKATGGKTVTVDRAKELKTGIETLLLRG
jgi:Mg-chelatase subunit ChlD